MKLHQANNLFMSRQLIISRGMNSRDTEKMEAVML